MLLLVTAFLGYFKKNAPKPYTAEFLTKTSWQREYFFKVYSK
jgi:hypothetical protein